MKLQCVLGRRWRKMLGALVLLACFAPLVACGISPIQGTSGPSSTAGISSTASPASTPTPSYGTLNGDVVASPTCPVESSVNPCAPKPVTFRAVAVLRANSQTIAKTTTDEHGYFSVNLPPGTYTVKVAIIPGTVGMRQVTPAQVTITSGQTTHITIVLDTGIR